MLKVGITGNIGSGKTTVCKIFETLSIPVYYADDRAKWLMNHKVEIVSAIKKLFGEEVYTKGGTLNRPYLASIVFKDKEKLEALNQIVHPAVARDGLEWNEIHKNAIYTLKEAAILFESGSYKGLDKVICVLAPEELRLKRVMNRDGSKEEEVRARMDKQWKQNKKARLSDFLIYNDGKESLIKQVLRIHKKLSKWGDKNKLTF